MRYKKVALLLVVIILISLVPASALEINIPQQTYISADNILLGDIAQISGKDEEIIRDIEDVELSRSPLPGYSKRLSRELIRLVLRNKGYMTENIIFNIPDVFHVNTKSRKITGEELTSFVDSYIRKNINYSDEKLEIKINSSIDEIVIPDMDYELDIKGVEGFKPGNNSFPLSVIIAGKNYKQVYFNIQINLLKDVYVAAHDLKRGSYLTKENFKLVEKKINREIDTLVSEWDEEFFRERVLSVSLQEGQILQGEMVEKPVVVNWGDRVKAAIKVGQVEVSTVVSARARGKIGDFITVENEDTGQRFKARVVNSHLVEVEK